MKVHGQRGRHLVTVWMVEIIEIYKFTDMALATFRASSREKGCNEETLMDCHVTNDDAIWLENDTSAVTEICDGHLVDDDEIPQLPNDLSPW